MEKNTVQRFHGYCLQSAFSNSKLVEQQGVTYY